MQLMEIYVGTKYQVSKTPQVNIKRFKNVLSDLLLSLASGLEL
jgi:hypothetical protein